VGRTFDLKIGISMNPHWVFHVSYLNHYISSLKTENNIYNQFSSDEFVYDVNGFGLGVTYYTQKDLYFSLSGGLNFSYLRNDYLREIDCSRPGYQIKFGKEWWLAKRLAINIAGVVYPYAVGVKIYEVNYGASIGLTFHKKHS